MKLFPAAVLLLLINLFGLVATAQESAKIDLFTRQLLHSGQFKRAASGNINLFVQGDKDAVAQVAAKAGGYLKYAYGNISAVNIPVKNLDQFLSNKSVLKVENADVPMKRLCDSAIVSTGVLQVQTGQAPLDSGYKGDGVIVGIIDGGVYFQHQDFKNPDGTTRIRYIWDQNDTINGNDPIPYGYGQEWTFQDINAGRCTEVDALNDFGHGTHVTGIAAGNGSASNHYSGMAPNATIIEVCANEGNNFLSDFTDACDYIFKKADAMGMPCVINASVGTYYGSHDGKDMAAQLINAMLEQRCGRSLVCALGNAGQQKMHLGYNVTADTSFSWFNFNSAYQQVYWEDWADSVDMDSLYFSVGADDPSTNTYLGNIGFHNVHTDYGLDTMADSSQIVSYILYNGTTFVATVYTQLTKSAGRYSLEFLVNPQDNNYLWRFITTGKGRADVWSSSGFMPSTSDIINTVPDTSVNPTYVNYIPPDTLETLVSSFTCSDDVISVGNYVNRTSYADVYFDTIRFFDMTTGSLFKDDNPNTASRLGSSYGPTRDGRLKPDISAPGGIVIATGDPVFIANAINSGDSLNYDKVAWTGKHIRNSGTSMASPVVAGAVALYLQKNPNACYDDIKKAFTSSARKDSFTGPSPNIAFGYGKLDCFAALQTNVHYGCTDTGAINYDPAANYDNGSCIAKVYGCMDADADNYNPLANVADTCIFLQSGITTAKTNNAMVTISPNPSNGNPTIYYYIGSALTGTAHVVFTDLLGRTISDIHLDNAQGNIVYQNPTKGVYIYTLQVGDKVYTRKKLIIF